MASQMNQTALKKQANCKAKGIDVKHINFLNNGFVHCTLCNKEIKKTSPSEIKRHINTPTHKLNIDKLNNGEIKKIIKDEMDIKLERAKKGMQKIVETETKKLEEKKKNNNIIYVDTTKPNNVLPKPDIKQSMDMDLIAKMVNHMSEDFIKQLLEKDKKIKELEDRIKDLEENDEIIISENSNMEHVDIELIKKDIKTVEEDYESEEEVIIDNSDKVYIDDDHASDISDDDHASDISDDDVSDISDEEEELSEEQQKEEDIKTCKKWYDTIIKKSKSNNIEYHKNFSYKDILKCYNNDIAGKTIIDNFTNPKWVKRWNKEKKNDLEWLNDKINEYEKELKILNNSLNDNNKHIVSKKIKELEDDINKLQNDYL
jgi:hypothetical protein